MKTFLSREGSSWSAVVLGTVLAIAVAAGGALADDADVIGRVGNTAIKADQVRSFIESLDPSQQAAIASNPAVLPQVVRQLLAQRAVIQEALAKKWDQRPAVAALIDRARENTIAESYLASVSKPPDGYPSDAELQSAYDANLSAFLAPRQFQLAQIFIAASRDADSTTEKAARAKLNKVQKRLRPSRADFAAIAKEESEEPTSAGQGGNMGWAAENQIKPEIRSVVLGLAKGAVADPIRLDDGWHIVKLLDTKAAATKPLTEVRDQLVRQMRVERAQEMRRAFLAKILEKNPVAINELALEKVLSKPAK